MRLEAPKPVLNEREFSLGKSLCPCAIALVGRTATGSALRLMESAPRRDRA